ncbi:MAG: site-specific DNA-methyltransferase [Bacteroidales bacterium]|nr:site-specific DNA-methyltransferase [Bacteroidales bacterium]
MENLLDELVKLLQGDRQKRFVDDNGELLKSNLTECIDKLDAELFELLLQNEYIRQNYFLKIGDVYILKEKDFKKFFNNKLLLKDSYTAFKQKIGLYQDERHIKQNDDYVLCWPYKDCILEGGQTKEDDRRKEIFWNTVLSPNEVDKLLSPKVFTNFKRYSIDGEKETMDIDFAKDNFVIKGNNLLALHCLKNIESVRGKVKLIYIDPPYNTGNDSFLYNDNFNHSTWLTFMKNRLEVARELLSEDGAIFIQCDDNEQAYLKLLCDEVFGRENFVNTICVRSSTPSGLKTAHREKTIIKIKDYILVYAKDGTNIKFNPQYTKKEKWDTHYNSIYNRLDNSSCSLVDIMIENGLLKKGDNLNDIDLNNKDHKHFYLKYSENIYSTSADMPKEQKKYSLENFNKIISYKGSDGKEQFAYNGRRFSFLNKTVKKVFIGSNLENDIANLLCDFWNDIDFNNTQNQGNVNFISAKKPEQLLYRIIDMTTKENDLVLDFFCGSGTTCAVAHKMKRRYIGIEQMNYIENITCERMKKVIAGEQGGISRAMNWEGGGDFVYMELSALNEKYRQELVSAEDNEALNNLFIKMQKSKHLRIETEEIKREEFFEEQDIEKKRSLLLELLDYNQLYHNYSEMEDEDYNISQADKELNKKIYKKE